MKTTGMVRRIDELGRIVIPKEIRKQLMMQEGESISFSLEDDKIILTKFSLLNKLSPVIESLLEGLYQKYHNTFLISNLDSILMSSSDGLTLYQRKPISQELLLSFQQNQEYKEKKMMINHQEQIVTTFPIKIESRVVGCFFMITKQTPLYMVDESLLEFVRNIIEQEMERCV